MNLVPVTRSIDLSHSVIAGSEAAYSREGMMDRDRGDEMPKSELGPIMSGLPMLSLRAVHLLLRYSLQASLTSKCVWASSPGLLISPWAGSRRPSPRSAPRTGGGAGSSPGAGGDRSRSRRRWPPTLSTARPRGCDRSACEARSRCARPRGERQSTGGALGRLLLVNHRDDVEVRHVAQPLQVALVSCLGDLRRHVLLTQLALHRLEEGDLSSRSSGTIQFSG